MMPLADRGIVAAQPNAAHWKAGITVSLWNSRFLQQRQRAAASAESITEAARRATADARPLPMTAYKLDLLSGLVRDVLERLAG